MKRISLTVIGSLLLTLSSAQAALVGLDDYTGTITYDGGDGGITAANTNPWLNEDTSLSWEVTDNNNGTWTYKYVLDVGETKDISHFILEVSDNFTENDYLSGPEGELKTYSGSDPSNPDMPDSLYGIKWEDQNTTNWELEFTTTKGPTWGDFFAIDGLKNEDDGPRIWNLGFTNPDDDDPMMTANGEWDHIVVPDTVTTPSIPAPAAVLLSALGTCTVSWLRRRKIV